jgi:hypothetical protein
MLVTIVAMRRLLVLSIATGTAMLLAPTAMAGSLPAPGSWVYNGTTKAVPSVKFYVNTTPGAANIYSVDAIVSGRCGKQHSSIFAVAVQNEIHLAVKDNGTFSTKWFKTVGDATGEKGKAKIKGVFKGTKVTGRITARQHGSAFGKCSASKKKFKATGEQVG